jgi:hypothetical protein
MNDSLATSYPLAVEPFARARVAAVADADRRRPIVVVLGMHRSGTSLCAHILSAMGIDMTDAIGEHPSNTRGHWERWEIVEFHDRILGLFNRDYYGPFHDFSLPVAWWADPRVFAIKREIVGFLERRMGDGYFGFKDPRTVRLMPVWHQIFNDLKLAPKIVHCLRDPAQVARSVEARDGLDPEMGEYRWLTHMVDFFRYSGDFDICTVEFERWFTDPFGNFEQLKKFLDVPWQQSESDLGLVLSGIVDPALRHDGSDHREAGQPLVRSLYALARGDHPDGGARHQTSDIITQHINFQKLLEPFQRAFENIAGIAAKLPQVEQEAADLRAAVGERDAHAEAMGAAIAGLREDLARAELESVEASAVAEAICAEITSSRIALAGAEREAQDRAAAGEALQAEINSLRSALAAVERRRLEREAATAALQGEIAAMHQALAEAEQRRQQGEAAIAALQSEITKLHQALAEAEQHRQQPEAATATLHAQIASLRHELAVAREVGRAALASLRLDPATAPEVPRKTGWLALVRRPFGSHARLPSPLAG